VSLQIQQTVAGIRAACSEARENVGRGSVLGLVPTMGALHKGHLSLIRAAKKDCDVVVVSIFVNPTQFGPNEDFDQYPRTFEADCDFLRSEGVDLLFAPTVADMYPSGLTTTFVDVPDIGSRLDGGTRPGHFRGVATIVSKLFHIVCPDLAYFGQKDAAQVAVLRAMVKGLSFPLRILVCPTVRESDGLALSSRNRYLSPGDRQQALALSTSLRKVADFANTGMHDTASLLQVLEEGLSNQKSIRIDYAAIVNPETLLPIPSVHEGALVAVAAYVGKTRLIDNIVLPPISGEDR
jgi:pantoate--beta-alanine ligase